MKSQKEKNEYKKIWQKEKRNAQIRTILNDFKEDILKILKESATSEEKLNKIYLKVSK